MNDFSCVKIDTSKMSLEELLSAQTKVRNLLFEARCIVCTNIRLNTYFKDFFGIDINLANMSINELNNLIGILHDLISDLTFAIHSKSKA